MDHIIHAKDSPNSFYFYGSVGAKYPLKVRENEAGEKFTYYTISFNVYKGHQFLEQHTNNYKAPLNSKVLNIALQVTEGIYNNLEKGNSILVKGELDTYISDSGEVRFKITTKDVCINCPKHTNENSNSEKKLNVATEKNDKAIEVEKKEKTIKETTSASKKESKEEIIEQEFKDDVEFVKFVQETLDATPNNETISSDSGNGEIIEPMTSNKEYSVVGIAENDEQKSTRGRRRRTSSEETVFINNRAL